jgi:Predicted DNA-binding protein containing a Zn-ribbon domain
MRFLIGVDDTDNPKTSSTGLLAQRLGLFLQENGLGQLQAVTRHQLLLSAQVPHTSDNSAICITFEADAARRSELEMACRAFILREYSTGADAGFAMTPWAQVGAEVFTWARTVKNRVVSRQEAMQIARSSQIAIAGLTGSGAGVIGALAAIGLRFKGEDGRFLWLPDLNELSGIYTCSEIMSIAPIDRIESLRGRSPRPDEKVEIGKWIRPILREGRCVLLVEEEKQNQNFDWHLLGMEEVRRISD